VPEADLDLAIPRTVHIVGLGGGAMSALATVLVGMGHRVSGSDLRDSSVLARLRDLGVTVFVGHAAANVPRDADVVVASTAIAPHNPEVQRAQELGVARWSRADAQRAVLATRRAIAVAGSHGKTTTSSMLALILRAAGWDPSFLIGADLNEVGANAAWDDGEWLVVEADESDGTFLRLPAEAAIITNVEPDHLDFYGGFEALVAAFHEFIASVPGPRVVSVDDPVAADLARAHPAVVTFGGGDSARYRMRGYEGHREGSRFVVEHDGRALGALEVPVPGRHNAMNALAAVAMAVELGAPFDAAQQALREFAGVARRYQVRGERGGVTYVDDYAHLPGEVRSMVAAAREGGFEHVVVVFQPHRYTRTARLWRDFADAFVGADTLVLTDVYAFDETPIPGVSGHLVLDAVLDAHPAQEVVYLPHRADLARYVPGLARPGDVVLTLGAGDLTMLPDEWLVGAP
jgi:UDP-N-acetylmuramate--alanine ligase